jgi:peptidoglycan/LPS O-acetylase OafA/YrhL
MDPGDRKALPFAAQVLTPCRLDTLTVGAWFALAARGPGGIDALASRVHSWIGPLALGVVALSAIHVARLRIDPIVEPVRLSTLSAFFGAVILVTAWRRGPALVRALLRQPWLRMLGKYSYGLYVYHGIVAYALHYDGLLVPLQAATGSRLAGVFLGALIGSALSIVLAILSYELYESKFLRLKRLFQTALGPKRELEPPVSPESPPDSAESPAAAANDPPGPRVG